jgi:hypothetical protein
VRYWRRRQHARRLACTAWLAFLLSPPPTLAAETWFLMARHGECSPIAGLARKFPDIGNVADPQAFVDFVRAKGLKVTSQAVAVPGGSAREVLVPEKDLSLLFVTAGLCASMGTR